MEKEQLFRKQEKQIEVYKELIRALEEVKPVVEKFNGKVMNVRLTNAMNEVITNDKISVWNIKSRLNRKYINIVNNNRSYPDGTQYGSGYIDFYDVDIWLEEAEGQRKLNSEYVLNEISEQIKKLEQNIKEEEKAIKDYDIMMADYKKICEQIRKFNEKYSYNARQDSKCLFNKYVY